MKKISLVLSDLFFIYQVVQLSRTAIRVRLVYEETAEKEKIWNKVYKTLSSLFADRGLPNVVIECANEAPEQAPSGKFREVIPMTNI